MPLQFKFDPNQEFQLDAIAALTELFEGQSRMETDVQFAVGVSSFATVPNRLDLGEAELLANLQGVQGRNQVSPDTELRCITETIDTGNGPETSRFYNFSVEMETGTGKTYVYLRTALELHQRYGFRKFIVVVPSIAIREGVLKTLQITEGHFQALYHNLPYRYYVYDSANLARIRQFALADDVEIMVMTLASFNKDANVIRQTTDRLQGATPIHMVQAARPILILDEPQNMESDISRAALASLKPLFALRYSATHREPYNLVYRLTPYEAYRQGLVKRIEVASVVREDAFLQPYIALTGIRTAKRTLTAKVRVHQLLKSGTIKERTLTLRPGDSLAEKTRRSEYQGYEVEEINAAAGFVRFANTQELRVGEELGSDRDALFDAQIRFTVQEHMRKQQRLRQRGIKILSLFFIDRVANYARQDGLIRQLFTRAFDDLKQRFPAWQEKRPEEVQAAYFAQRRTREGEIILEDSKTGEAQRDQEAYDLIMKDKERLLSFEQPEAFIFSHSALREGWDSPNVCQICTLNQSASDIKKRQEIGRGVRLVVDQSGQRVHDEQVNILTVVANESYEQFVATLQDELAFEYRAEIEARFGKPIGALSPKERRRVVEEYGEGFLAPKPRPRAERITSNLRKEYTLKPEFQELWERIKHKTRYAVRVDSDRLVDDVVQALEEVQVKPPRVTVTKAQVAVGQENIFEALQASGAKTVVDLVGRYPLPNLVSVMEGLMAHTSPPMRITRRTLLEIIRRAPPHCQQAMVENPTDFASEAVRRIKDKLSEQLVAGIQYEKINQWYEMDKLDVDFQDWENHLVPSRRFDGSEGAALYDHVPVDSDIERQFVADLERRNDVRLYVKLPSWFTVPTPIGEYNPDWAIVMDDPQGEPDDKPLLYLVRETKATCDLSKLRPDERQKVRCGKQHFTCALGVDYRIVKEAKQLP